MNSELQAEQDAENKPVVSIEVIMSDKEYQNVKSEYEQARKDQSRIGYKIRKCLSQSILGKFFCCCLKVKNRVDIPWDQMTPAQKKFRIKRLWIKARLVYHFIRMKQSATDGRNGKIE